MSSLPCLALLDFFVTTVVVGCKRKKKNIMTVEDNPVLVLSYCPVSHKDIACLIISVLYANDFI